MQLLRFRHRSNIVECADLAVAAGPNIYVYRKLKPYFKFKLPVSEPNEEERSVWDKAKTGEVSIHELWTKLDQLKYVGSLISRYCLTVATCMQTLYRQQASPDSVQCLVVGAEQNCLFIIDPTTFILLTTITTPTVPVHLITTGSYDIQFRILVACRDGIVYHVKRGSDSVQRLFNPNSQIVGLVRADKTIVVGCVDQTVKGYSLKGHPMWTVRHPAPIASLIPVTLVSQNLFGYVLSLTDGTLRLYKDQHVCDEILTWPRLPRPGEKGAVIKDDATPPPSLTNWNPTDPDPVVTGVFGRYDREMGALSLMTRDGVLLLLLVKRSAHFTPTGVIPIHTQQERCLLEPPKRTTALTQSVQRELSNCVTIAQQYSKDLSVMKHLIAKTYLELLETRVGPVSTDPSRWPITLHAQTNGHGPQFHIVFDLTTTSSASKPQLNLSLVHQFDDTVYRMDKPAIPVSKYKSLNLGVI
ncbi:unnamed protein product [Echinostoma caproni]|uniref:BBS1 domain-containing protein n=1 Tax=Echinostoma caproni TaxID=27848 RepID=A0A183AVU7_9TREM|nr:unnamed protein product [Echinostoma caproni]